MVFQIDYDGIQHKT